MLITATWRVTLGSLTPAEGEPMGVRLLDWTDCMESEPQIARDSTIEEVRPIGAQFRSFQPRGHIAHLLSFTRMKRFATPAAARAFLLSHTAALPYSKALNCTIEMFNSGTPGSTILHGAVIQPGGYTARTESEKFFAQYRLLGGEVEAVSPGSPP